ncbi:hypothetical protein [Thermoplasma sp.]|nr:hypothetical protein [Thermoplasma sp.]
MNKKARKAMRAHVSVVTLDGDEYLFDQAPKPNVALIKRFLWIAIVRCII